MKRGDAALVHALASTRAVRLSSLDKNALGSLEKHGEMILDEDGKHFRNSSNFGFVERKRIEKLVTLGLARIDRVGESTFAVPVAQ